MSKKNFQINWDELVLQPETPNWSGIDLTKKTIDLGMRVSNAREAARGKLIQKAKVPFRDNSTEVNDALDLQTRLFNEGLLGTDANKAIDGKIGAGTRRALNVSLLRLLIKLGLLDNSKGNADDGIMGMNFNNALVEALKQGYVLKNGVLSKKEPIPEERPSLIDRVQTGVSNFVHSTSNNPLVTAAEDALVGTTNNLYRGAKDAINTGYKYITNSDENLVEPGGYIVKNRDIYNIPEDLKNFLREQILKKARNGNYNIAFTTKDWKNLLGTYTGGNRSISDRISTPQAIIEHSWGLWGTSTDSDGNVYAEDTYDWNVGDGSAGLGYYSVARDLMGKLGTRSDAPEGQARHYRINLGNPKDWKI